MIIQIRGAKPSWKQKQLKEKTICGPVFVHWHWMPLWRRLCPNLDHSHDHRFMWWSTDLVCKSRLKWWCQTFTWNPPTTIHLLKANQAKHIHEYRWNIIPKPSKYPWKIVLCPNIVALLPILMGTYGYLEGPQVPHPPRILSSLHPLVSDLLWELRDQGLHLHLEAVQPQAAQRFCDAEPPILEAFFGRTKIS